jgi:hypothetical protein
VAHLRISIGAELFETRWLGRSVVTRIDISEPPLGEGNYSISKNQSNIISLSNIRHRLW